MKASWVFRSCSAIAVALIAVLVVAPGIATAHPLGNFTVNHYSRIETSATAVRVVYVLDQAEIPTFQDQPAVDSDQSSFTENRTAQIKDDLSLQVDGRPLELVQRQALLTQPEGEGGLKTLRLSIVFEAQLDATQDPLRSLTFVDRNEPDRIGWREIVARPTGDSTIESSSVSNRDVSNELRAYPESLLQAPLDVRRAELTFVPGTMTPPLPTLSESSADAPKRSADRFGDLAGETALNVGGVVVALGLALVFGAGHALGPGHGKSVMAAYLVGTRGRPSDAIWLGVIVALMHTGSVLALGFGLLAVDTTMDLSRLYPLLTLVSGIVIVGFGLVLGVVRLRSWLHRRAHEKEHAHGHHHHDSAGVHSHGGFSHSHEVPDGVAPLSRKGLLVLAGSGGLLPSPSAVIVIISSASLGRLPLGLALVGVFSVGLAATLSAVGLSLVYGRDFMSRRPGSKALLRVLPLLSALALIVLGAVVIYRGLVDL